jgi:hypothetical protein
MKVPLARWITVASAERMARRLGLALLAEDGRVYLVGPDPRPPRPRAPRARTPRHPDPRRGD